MAKKLRVMHDVKVHSESFKGVKRSVVPNQSMSLHEIVRRFIKKESLPINKEGFYAEDLGDIEKMSREDFTEKQERIKHLQEVVKKGKKHEKDQAEKAKKDADEKEKSRLEELRRIAADELAKKPQGPANSPPS